MPEQSFDPPATRWPPTSWVPCAPSPSAGHAPCAGMALYLSFTPSRPHIYHVVPQAQHPLPAGPQARPDHSTAPRHQSSQHQAPSGVRQPQPPPTWLARDANGTTVHHAFPLGLEPGATAPCSALGHAHPSVQFSFALLHRLVQEIFLPLVSFPSSFSVSAPPPFLCLSLGFLLGSSLAPLGSFGLLFRAPLPPFF